MATGSEQERVSLRFFFDLEKKGKLDVVKYCMSVGLISRNYTCSNCNENMKLVERKDKDDGYNWVCRVYGNNKHYVKRSIRCGSWFEESKLSLIDVLQLTYLWVKKTRNEWITDELGISKNTVTDWMNFCREVCVEVVVRESVKLGGPGKIVEIDESKFSKRKYNRGKRVKGEWVFGGVERQSNVCFVEVVENRSAAVLLDVLTKYVLPGSTVISDCWKAYDCLEDEGFVHLKVNHSITFKDPDTGAHTNTIEGMWNCIKRNLKQVRKIDEGFDSYLSEFMWRRRHQENYPKLFNSFLDAIRDVYPAATQDGSKIKALKTKN